MPARFDIDTKELLRAQRALGVLGQPKLRQTTNKALTKVVRTTVVPEMQKQVASAAQGKSPRRPSGMAPPKRGTKGPLAKSVRVKRLKTRNKDRGEMVAMGVAPRAWYRHWFIKGTKPHSLAKGANRKKNIKQDTGRWHRGARGHDIVNATGRAIAARVNGSVGRDILDSFKKQMGKR